MISLWAMMKGRVVAALVATILSVLALMGFDVLSEATINAATVFATAVVTFFQFIGYAAFHTFATRRRLLQGKTAVENVERLTMPRMAFSSGLKDDPNRSGLKDDPIG